MKITDGKKTAELIMMMDGYPDDMSYLHFGAALLRYDEAADTYHVGSVDLCIMEAQMWEQEEDGRYVNIRT